MASKTEQGKAKTRASSSAPGVSAKVDEVDDPLVLPMQKASPVAYIAIGLGVAIVGGLAAFFAGGDDKPAAEVAPSAAPPAITKEDAKAREEHLRNTQAALVAAARETTPSAPAAPAEPVPAEPALSESEAPSEKAPAKTTKVASRAPAPPKSKPPAPKPADTGKSKKRAADLDALGADITSQLK